MKFSSASLASICSPCISARLPCIRAFVSSYMGRLSSMWEVKTPLREGGREFIFSSFYHGECSTAFNCFIALHTLKSFKKTKQNTLSINTTKYPLLPPKNKNSLLLILNPNRLRKPLGDLWAECCTEECFLDFCIESSVTKKKTCTSPHDL